MTNGLTNASTGEDHAMQGPLGVPDAVVSAATGTDAEMAASQPGVYTNADSWRVEVAARLERYRTRRKPRTPRYPSLLLPFDAPESWSRPATAVPAVSTSPSIAELQRPSQFVEHVPDQIPEAEPDRYSELAPELSGKVIEFPRSAAIPVFQPSDLADPVFDRPRIVEAPEILPPPPALGGMLIEPVHQETADKRSEVCCASPSASIARRALAALVDGAVLTAALAGFAAIFIRFNPSFNPSLNTGLNSVRGALSMFAGGLGVVAVALWAAYKFLFVVYTGSTPGLRAARLQLAGFDGSPLDRRARRWRVLASFLSAFSAGLGYLWCVLDQDGLCWHDRITRSHLQSLRRPEVRPEVPPDRP